MPRTTRTCRIAAAIAILGVALHILPPWRPGVVTSQILIAAAAVLAILGTLPGLVAAAIRDTIRDELAAARTEGILDGALRERITRADGEPPRPRYPKPLRSINGGVN